MTEEIPNDAPDHAPRENTTVSRSRRLLRLLEVDRAVLYSISARAWQVAAGSVTAILIVLCFTEDVQGYYYAFGSLLAVQTFVELGLPWVVMYLASHEWSDLSLDDAGRVQGPATAKWRLADLARFVLRWYAVATLLLLIVLGSIGFYMFSGRSDAVAWAAPWCIYLLMAGGSLILSPLIALLEGCDQMVTVHRYRLIQAVMGNVVFWTSIALGAQLWVVVLSMATQLGCELWLVRIHYGRFWKSLFAGAAEPAERLCWRSEVWPLQWRLALQSVFRYFAFSLFVPVMFHFHGPGIGGRTGMTWAILTAFQMAAFSWVRTRIPKFGNLIAKRDFAELDRRFLRLTVISTAVLSLALLALILGVWGVNHWNHLLAEHLRGRMLGPLPTVMLSLGILCMYIPQCLGVYLRAHRKDPLLGLSMVANSMIGVIVFFAGARYGIDTATAGFLGVILLVTLPGSVIIWLRCRAAWHA